MPLTFQPLSLKNQGAYKQLLAACPEKASDYSFINLWSWQEEYGLEWAWEEGLAWIRQTRPDIRYWAPVGDWKNIDWERVTRHLDAPTTFTRVPQSLTRIWEQRLASKMATHDARNHWDYLYSVQELVELKGNRFHKKKNLCNQFLRKYDFKYVELDRDQIEKALALQTEWCLWRDCQDSDVLLAENKAIVRAFHDWEQLDGIFGAGLMIDDGMIAYTVAEPLDATTVVIHFEKACPSVKGAYQAINQMFLQNTAAGYATVNREQDMGEEGLRKAKESYNPTGYLKKHRVVFTP